MKFKFLATVILLLSICSGSAIIAAAEVVVLLDPNIRPYVEALL